MDVGLRHRGNEVFVLALGFGNRFVRLSDIFFEGDGVAKLAFAFTLEFLETREVVLRSSEMSLGGGEFDSGIFACFGDCFYVAESLEVGNSTIEFFRRYGESGGEGGA